MNINLPKNEFEILKQDDEVIHLYDKVVDKIYVFVRKENKWIFPTGSRVDIIEYLSGIKGIF